MTKARIRTFIGIALFVPLAAVLLATFACLPAPVGDPDQSKVDPKLAGAWQASTGPDELTIALLRPWDAHTYFLQYIQAEKKDGNEKAGVLHFKAWLTKIGGATFITAETLDNTEYAFGQKDDKSEMFWMVGRVDIDGDTIKLRLVDEKSWIVKDLATREKLEAAIKPQVDNKELYKETITFKKIAKENMKIVEDAMKGLHVGL